MTLNCEQILEFLHEGIDGELEGAQDEQFRSHLKACPDCARQAESIRRLKKLVLVKMRREPVPPGLERRIRERLDAEHVPTRVVARTRPVLLSAAALLIVGLTVLFVLNDWGSLSIPSMAHATVIDASELAARESEWSPLQSSRLDDYLRNTFGVETDRKILSGAGLSVVGWAPHLFDDKVQAVRVELQHKRGAEAGKITCFAFRGKLFPTDEDNAHAERHRALGKDRARDLPSGKVCCCRNELDDHRVICCRSSDGMHFIMVLDGDIADEFLDLCAENEVGLHGLLVRK